jgi:outer membrane protein OmpA-like peptidoglycan-associated protein
MMVEAKKRADYSARTMTRPIFLGLLAAALFAIPAQAQMYPGQGITVNPAAINGAGDGYSSPYARNPYAADVIHLHMPKPVVHHHHVAAKPAPADVATTAPTEPTPPQAAAPANTPPPGSNFPPPLDTLSDTSTPPAPAPAPVKHTHHTHAAAAATPPPASPSDSGSGTDASLPLTLDPQDEHPVATPPKHSHADVAKPQNTASTDTAPAATTVVHPSASSANNGLTRRSEILFPRGDPDISSATVDKMRTVAADLTTLLGAGASRVQLDAYGGAPGDKGSDARRLSLKRALGVRELLIEDGVPSEKIDVRALGGIDDGGAPDRVDVMVRGG